MYKENKYPELSHETFYLCRDGVNEFSCCKTDRKPYDLLVQACLLVFKHYAPFHIELRSDGKPEDWRIAEQFVRDVTGIISLFDIDLI